VSVQVQVFAPKAALLTHLLGYLSPTPPEMASA
jgi:hypothetical protein